MGIIHIVIVPTRLLIQFLSFPVACATVIKGVAIASTHVIPINILIKGTEYSGTVPNHKSKMKLVSKKRGREITISKDI